MEKRYLESLKEGFIEDESLTPNVSDTIDRFSKIIKEISEDKKLRYIFFMMLLEEDIFSDLESHFYDWFGSNGLIKEG